MRKQFGVAHPQGEDLFFALLDPFDSLSHGVFAILSCLPGDESDLGG